MEGGDEQPHTLALHPITIEVVCHYSGHKVLSSAGPAMEGEGEGLIGVWVFYKALHGFQNHCLGQVLPMKLLL